MRIVAEGCKLSLIPEDLDRGNRIRTTENDVLLFEFEAFARPIIFHQLSMSDISVWFLDEKGKPRTLTVAVQIPSRTHASSAVAPRMSARSTLARTLRLILREPLRFSSS